MQEKKHRTISDKEGRDSISKEAAFLMEAQRERSQIFDEARRPCSKREYLP